MIRSSSSIHNISTIVVVVKTVPGLADWNILESAGSVGLGSDEELDVRFMLTS